MASTASHPSLLPLSPPHPPRSRPRSRSKSITPSTTATKPPPTNTATITPPSSRRGSLAAPPQPTSKPHLDATTTTTTTTAPGRIHRRTHSTAGIPPPPSPRQHQHSRTNSLCDHDVTNTLTLTLTPSYTRPTASSRARSRSRGPAAGEERDRDRDRSASRGARAGSDPTSDHRARSRARSISGSSGNSGAFTFPPKPTSTEGGMLLLDLDTPPCSPLSVSRGRAGRIAGRDRAASLIDFNPALDVEVRGGADRSRVGVNVVERLVDVDARGGQEQEREMLLIPKFILRQPTMEMHVPALELARAPGMGDGDGDGEGRSTPLKGDDSRGKHSSSYNHNHLKSLTDFARANSISSFFVPEVSSDPAPGKRRESYLERVARAADNLSHDVVDLEESVPPPGAQIAIVDKLAKLALYKLVVVVVRCGGDSAAAVESAIGKVCRIGEFVDVAMSEGNDDDTARIPVYHHHHSPQSASLAHTLREKVLNPFLRDAVERCIFHRPVFVVCVVDGDGNASSCLPEEEVVEMEREVRECRGFVQGYGYSRNVLKFHVEVVTGVGEGSEGSGEGGERKWKSGRWGFDCDMVERLYEAIC